MYVATTDGSSPLSNAVIALESKTLTLKGSVTVPKADFSSSPLIFQWKDTDAVVAAGGGRLFVFDAAMLQGGPIASAPVGSASYDTGALASWVDAQSTRWIAVPSARGIAALKVVEQDGKIAVQPGWTSRVIASPLAFMALGAQGFAQELPDGPGKDVAVRVCGQCHEPQRAASVRLTREGWEGVLAKMADLGMEASEDELKQVP